MAENENTKAKKQVPLRLSASLYDELARWAEDDFRSINGQIEYLLTECVNKRRKSKSKLVFQMTAEELANSGFEIDLPDGSKKRYRNFREFLCELDEENGSGKGDGDLWDSFQRGIVCFSACGHDILRILVRHKSAR